LKWGHEFSAAANIGARTDNPKMYSDGVSLQVLLHDIHMSLVKNILIVRKNQHDAAIQLLNKIPCPDVVSMKFNYTILCVIYIRHGWYCCIEFDHFIALVIIF